MPTSSLARLVGDREAFLHDTFGRTPQVIPGTDEDAFDDILSLSHVDEIVTTTGLRAPAFRLVRDGATLPMHEVTRPARIGSRPVHDLIDLGAVHTAFGDGASIVLQGLHRSWEPVAKLCRSLERELTHPVQANAYLTPPVAQGLNLHEDPHDVFAVQTHGVKRWVVHPPGGDTPWDLELRPGDVLYLPAGTRHAAQTVDLPSLHLTIGVRTVAWADALRRMLDTSLTATSARRPLPPGWADDPGAHRDAVREHLEDVVTALREGGDHLATSVLEELADDFWSARTPERRGGLIDLLEVERLSDTSPLRVRGDISLRLVDDGEGQATLVLADRRVHLPRRLHDVLEHLVTQSTFRPCELDALIDRPSRLVLCRRLVREGVLTFDRAPGRAPA